MIHIKPFKAVRPTRDKAYLVSSKPFYTYKKHILEAKMEQNPYTFLHIINPEFDRAKHTKPNTVERFKYVRERYEEFKKEGIYEKDSENCFYLYKQTVDNHEFIGLVCGIRIDDYKNGKIKIHEQTITERENLFTQYLEVCSINAEPVLLSHEHNENIEKLYSNYFYQRPEYEFSTTDKIKHELWLISNEKDILFLENEFKKLDCCYIADGHHRAASSLNYAQKKIDKNNQIGNNYFLAFLIDENKLKIREFNRLVHNLNGLTNEEFILQVQNRFDIEFKGEENYYPVHSNEISMYIDYNWYKLTPKQEIQNSSNPIEKLSTDILTKHILTPILSIIDLKTDNRIYFVDGSQGLDALKVAVDTHKAKVAFALYPITVQEIKDVADNNCIMPPKSTWIEPKLRSGLIIFELDDQIE